MGSSDTQANAKHHYVQKAYLDNFAENERIDVVVRETGMARKGQGTDSVALIRGLYSSTDSDGNKDGSLEGAFNNDIEAPGIQIINNATSVFPYVPTGRERITLAAYVALQYLRTPESKRRFESDFGRVAAIESFNKANFSDDHLIEIIKKTGSTPSKKNLANLRNKINSDLESYEIVPHNNQWLRSIAAGLDLIVPILLKRYNWSIFHYNSSKVDLITSDHPVIVRSINQGTEGVGFGSADEVIFPLGKKHCLVLSVDSSIQENVYHIEGDYDITMINEIIYHNSYMEIYTPPSMTDNFEGVALGRRAITVMSGGPEKGIDFLRQYSGVLQRERPMR